MNNELLIEPEVSGSNLRETYTPLFHQPAWINAVGGARIVSIPPAGAVAIPSVALQEEKSRALPGHRLLRVARFGHGWPRETWKPVVEALASVARNDSRVLRLNIEVFLRSHKDELRQILRASGFVPTELRSYRHTLTLPLEANDEVLLTARRSLRRRMREAEKAGVVVRALTDTAYIERIEELQRISMERSGGAFRTPDWNALLKLSAEHPELSRVAGLFPNAETTAPGDLLAVAWGCMHGDHAENRAAAVAEVPRALRSVSLSIPPVFHLLQWSRQVGATWFDLGGVSIQEGADDPLGNISGTKRMVSETVEEVGEEWMLDPRPWKSRVAAYVGKVAGAAAKIRTAQDAKTA